MTNQTNSLFFNKNNLQITNNTIPCGFVFSRVGANKLDINLSGVLYVCYDRYDFANYVLQYTNPLRFALIGYRADYVQRIVTKQELTLASEKQTITELAKLLLSNESLLNAFRSQLTHETIKRNYRNGLKKALANPQLKEAREFIGVVFTGFSYQPYVDEVNAVYEHFRNCGFDAIPDLADTILNDLKTATIILNPNKVELLEVSKINEPIKQEAEHLNNIRNACKDILNEMR